MFEVLESRESGKPETPIWRYQGPHVEGEPPAAIAISRSQGIIFMFAAAPLVSAWKSPTRNQTWNSV